MVSVNIAALAPSYVDKFMDLNIRKDTNAVGSSNIVHCLSCGAVGRTVFYTADIPSYGSMDLSSFSCDKCGYRYSKTSSSNHNNVDKCSLSDYGMKTTLTVTESADLQRSVVIHDEAIISIPELDIKVRSMLGGKISTVEGAITSLYNEIKSLNIVGANLTTDKNDRRLQKSISEKLRNLLVQFEDDDTTKYSAERTAFKFCLIDPLNKSFISPRESKDKKKMSLLRNDGIVVHKSDTNDPNLFLEKFDLDEDDKLNLGLCEGENKESRETAKALWGDDFDNGYEFIPNPTNEESTVSKSTATDEECCKFLLQMAGGEFLEDGSGDY